MNVLLETGINRTNLPPSLTFQAPSFHSTHDGTSCHFQMPELHWKHKEYLLWPLFPFSPRLFHEAFFCSTKLMSADPLPTLTFHPCPALSRSRTHGIWKCPGEESTLSLSCNPRHSCGRAGSLSHGTTDGTPLTHPFYPKIPPCERVTHLWTCLQSSLGYSECLEKRTSAEDLRGGCEDEPTFTKYYFKFSHGTASSLQQPGSLLWHRLQLWPRNFRMPWTKPNTYIFSITIRSIRT